MMQALPTSRSNVADRSARASAAHDALDAWVREVVDWHFNPETGSPFWLDVAKKAGWDPRTEIKAYRDLTRFGQFQDEWLRGGPVQRWIPRGLAGKPVFVFETGGTTGVPKTRVGMEDFRTDYEIFSGTLPDEHFPKGSNWLMLGPSGPRRLRLSVEHLAQYPGRDLLLPRSRPTMGHQVDQEGVDRPPSGVQGSRNRSGGDDPPSGSRHPLHVRDTQAARGSGVAFGIDGHHDSQGRDHGHFLGRHGVHAAMEPLRA